MTPRIYITTHEDINGLKFYTVRMVGPAVDPPNYHKETKSWTMQEYVEFITDSHDEARRFADRLAFDTRRDLP